MIIATVGNVIVWMVWIGAAFACLGSGLAVVSFQNPFYSALALIGNLGSLAVTLFFGGWHVPWVESLDSYGPIWFVLKLVIFLCIFIWIRASLPRLRYDQLMRFGWKVLLPVATINALVTALLVVWI